VSTDSHHPGRLSDVPSSAVDPLIDVIEQVSDPVELVRNIAASLAEGGIAIHSDSRCQLIWKAILCRA
jgi:hypothetical protein